MSRYSTMHYLNETIIHSYVFSSWFILPQQHVKTILKKIFSFQSNAVLSWSSSSSPICISDCDDWSVIADLCFGWFFFRGRLPLFLLFSFLSVTKRLWSLNSKDSFICNRSESTLTLIELNGCDSGSGSAANQTEYQW